MRWILSFLSFVALGFSGAVHAQTEDPGVLDRVEVNETVTSVILVNGCKFILPQDDFLDGDGVHIAFLREKSSWSGGCNAQGLAEGFGVLRVGRSVDGDENSSYDVEVRFVNGLQQGRGRFGGRLSGEEWNFKDGCSEDAPYACDSTGALQLQARYIAAGGASPGGVQVAASATGGAVGQNRGKGGNPDWMYDDADHGKCVSVEGVPATGGGGLAYGHYKLINSCAYPITVRTCITPDRLDGSDSNYDLHQDGAKCPGMGWLGGGLKANEVQNGREWFEYNRLKWDIQVCREGWDFVGEDDRYPSDILGLPYGCRTRRAGK